MHSFVRSSSIRRKVSTAALTGLSLFTLGACEGDDEVPTRVRFSDAPTMTVSDKASTLSIGETQQLSGTVRDGQGNVLNVPISWTSSDPDVITVSASGLVTAVGIGSGSVVASATNGARTGAAFTVVGAPAATVQISGATTPLSVGSARQLTAEVLDANGNPVVSPLSWTSSNPAAATVNDAGVVIGVGEGDVTITASSGTASGTFQVQSAFLTASLEMAPDLTTIAPGTTTQLTATPRDAAGNALALPVTWTLTAVNSPITLSPSGSLTIPAGTKGSALVQASVTDLGGTTTLQRAVNPLLPGVALTGLSGSNSGNNADDAHYYIEVPNGSSELVITLSGGSNDPDLYVYPPGATASACNPFLGNGSTETCSFDDPAPGFWRVRIEGFSATWAGWSLVANVE